MWLRRWHQKQETLRQRLKGTRIHRFLGERIFEHSLWHINKRSISGGLSLGVFIALTPTIPLQMLLAACAAIYFRVNVPIAMAACWLTNPITMIPIYVAAWQLGKRLVGGLLLGEAIVQFYSLDARSAEFIQQSLCLWTGSLIFAAVGALAAYLLVQAFWHVLHRDHTTDENPK